MPSSLELLSTGEASSPQGPPSDDVLRSVKAEGARRRAGRRRRNLALAVLGLALVTIPATTLRPGSGSQDQEINVASGGGIDLVPDSEPPATSGPSSDLLPGDPPATAAPTVEPSLPPPPLPPTPPPTEPPPTTAAVVPTSPASTAAPTTTALVCRNSRDVACGEFRWDPAPGPNQPLLASFAKAPATAVSGQAVTFEVTWSDGDAALTFDRFSFDGTGMTTACSMQPRYGPWTPPAVVPSGGTRSYTETFASPGTYTIRVELGTAGCESPYASDTAITTTLTVQAAPSG